MKTAGSCPAFPVPDGTSVGSSGCQNRNDPPFKGLAMRFAAMTSRPVVCVTGASAGVGRAIALAFAAEWGALIGLIARSAEALDEARREVAGLGGGGLPLPLDVADDAAVDAAAEQV